jgi:hypothetical protein
MEEELKREIIKTKIFKKKQFKMYICIHCFTQPRTVTCYMRDLSSGQGGRPMKKPQQS